MLSDNTIYDFNENGEKLILDKLPIPFGNNSKWLAKLQVTVEDYLLRIVYKT